MKVLTLFTVLSAALAMNAFASELDPQAPKIPNAIIVKTDGNTTEVFKADSLGNVGDNAAAAAGLAFVKDENKIATVIPGLELDQVTSNEAWCSWRDYRPSYRSYNYTYYSYSYRPYYSYSYSYNYNYYPSYSYSYRGCSYNYYYPRYY